MQELRELARKLLTDGTVQVVIGYEEGPRGVRPALITKAEAAERLIFDQRCTHNLAAYLSPRRAAVRALGKPAIVVKRCDACAVAGLLRESQRQRDEFVLIGVRCGGVLANPQQNAALAAENIADRCVSCERREPTLVDHLLGAAPPAPPRPASGSRRDARIAELEALSPDERWAFWQVELTRCIRCHACREVCPICSCERCVADKSQPQWIESSPHPRGNLAWHLTRALHGAGRCVDCGECERVCPADIPLGLITRKVAQVVAARFGHAPTDDPSTPAPIGTYRLDDTQEFIL